MKRMIVALALVTASSHAHAQSQKWPWGMADSSVREFLAAQWDTANVDQVERGFCAVFTVDSTDFDPYQGVAYRTYTLRLLMPMKSSRANPQSVVYECPQMPNVVRVHVHPPTTCDPQGKCRFGGVLAWQCEPSPQDVRLLLQEDQAFGVLQCDRNALTFWGFKEFRSRPAKRLSQ